MSFKNKVNKLVSLQPCQRLPFGLEKFFGVFAATGIISFADALRARLHRIPRRHGDREQEIKSQLARRRIRLDDAQIAALAGAMV